ncbi:MAG TPA: FeS-binding protein [Cyanobacteria bacterium UBA8530]|nr:FeS-binding protein [Cyanobacteria bacterium UBA8530]
MEADGPRTLRITPHPIIVVKNDRCSGCGRCVAACPKKILTLVTSNHRKYATLLHQSRCNYCGACTAACLLDAIAFHKKAPAHE